MIYTPLTKKAMKIAYIAHKDQVDKGGTPYIYHSIHLAEQMTDEKAICTALLHDVVEDTDITFDQLKEYGIEDDIIEALKALTYDKSIPYMDYIRRIGLNSIATRVKKADLNHNCDLMRLDKVDQKAMYRKKKYQMALKILEDINKNNG